MFSAEKFHSTLLRLMDVFPDHYTHYIRRDQYISVYEDFLKQKGLFLGETDSYIVVCKNQIQQFSPKIYHITWYFEYSQKRYFVATHKIVNGIMTIDPNYPWPLYYSENTDEFKDFWLCPNPLPQLQLKLAETFFGKQWHKHIAFSHKIHTEIVTPITHTSEKLL